MSTIAPNTLGEDVDDPIDGVSCNPVGGPVSAGWREATLTRAKELEALGAWFHRTGVGAGATSNRGDPEELREAVRLHIFAARQAAGNRTGLRLPHKGARMERAMSNLDAAEAHLMQLAPPAHLLGQMPSVLNHVQRHLRSSDPRRKHFERIATRVGVHQPDDPRETVSTLTVDEKLHEVELERTKIVSAFRAASSAAMREKLRLHSFRNAVVTATLLMTLLVVGFALIGIIKPKMIPLCFEPEARSEVLVVCPTSQRVVTPASPEARPSVAEIEMAMGRAVKSSDIFVVEVVGLAAAAIAAATAIRKLRGSSERSGLPVVLALLKLPTGAMTAVLGLLLMRGEFVPGLSALDSPAQIIAWALVFGYAQQLFTGMVDQQAHTVLNDIRSPKKSPYASGSVTPV